MLFGEGQWGYEVKQLLSLGSVPVTSNKEKKGIHTGYLAVVEVFVNTGPGKDDVTQFSDVGYGDAVEYTKAAEVTTHELAAKEAVSDGLKRALKNFGDQFGLTLYDKESPLHKGQAAQPQSEESGVEGII